MKLSEQQAMMLLDIAKGSLRFFDKADGSSPFGYDIEQRRALVGAVMFQQSTVPEEISAPEEEETP